MDADTATLFLKDCEEIFGFAVRDYGFSPGELVHHERGRALHVYFMGKTVALDCAFDYFEKEATLYVMRLQDGKRPTTPKFDTVDGEYQRVRALLHTILEHRRAPISPSPPIGKRELKAMHRKAMQMDDRSLWRAGLEVEASWLKEHAQDILRDDPSCFDGLEAEFP